MTRATVAEVVTLLFLPVLLFRAVGAEGVAILALPLSTVALVFLLSEAMWERSAFRGVRLLLRTDRHGEAAACRRRMARFGAGMGFVIALLLPALQPILFGDAASRTGSRWIVLAVLPALVFSGAIGARKGFLRARGAATELMAAGVLQTVMLLVLPGLFGALCARYGGKVDALLLTDHYVSVYGAVGAMAGISVAFFVSWLVVFLTGLRYRTPNPFSLRGERVGGGYAYFSAEGALFFISFGVCAFDLWQRFHGRLSEAETALLEEGSAVSGVALFGKYVAAVFSPAALTGCLLSLPFILSVYQTHTRFQREDVSSALDRYAGMVRHTMILALPVTLFMSALAQPLTTLFCVKPDEMATALFRVQILMAPFLCFGVLLALLFVRFGGIRAVLLAAGAGVAAHVAAALLFSAAGRGLYALVFAHLFGLFVFAAVTAGLLAGALSYRQEWLHGLLIPLICAALSSLPIFALAPVFAGLIGEVLTIVLLAVVGLFLYMALLTIFHGVTEYELYRIPGGRIFVGLARLFGRGV